MAAHEFGIMPCEPEKGVRYDAYEPHRYHCISVDDDALEDVLSCLSGVDFYWHTLDVPGKGLAYCGVTLIPPSSMAGFMAVIGDHHTLSALKALMQQARDQQKWIIHFGL